MQLARAGQGREKALAACGREARRLDALGRPDASAYAALSRAGVEAVRGDRDAARAQLHAARASFRELGMSLGCIYVAAAESSLGGAPEDGARPPAHEVDLRRHGIAQPRAWLGLYVPGFELPAPVRT